MGKVFPRVPGPPQSLKVLLYMLGVGSVVWYAVALSLPVMLWAARRVDTERAMRATPRLYDLAAAGLAGAMAPFELVRLVLAGGVTAGTTMLSSLIGGVDQGNVYYVDPFNNDIVALKRF